MGKWENQAELWCFTTDLLHFQPKDDSKSVFDNYKPINMYNLASMAIVNVKQAS